jgi:pyridoxine 5-phosphate synthase
LVLECKPEQVTLVPDAIGALTSSAGWDTVKNQAYLTEMIQEFQRNGIRTSIFVDPRLDMIEGLNKLVQTASNSTLKPLRMNMV